MPFPLILGATPLLTAAAAATDYTLAYICGGVVGGGATVYYGPGMAHSTYTWFFGETRQPPGEDLAKEAERQKASIESSMQSVVGQAQEGLDEVTVQTHEINTLLHEAVRRINQNLTAITQCKDTLGDTVDAAADAARRLHHVVEDLRIVQQGLSSGVVVQQALMQGMLEPLMTLPMLMQTHIQKLESQLETRTEQRDRVFGLFAEARRENEQLRAMIANERVADGFVSTLTQ